MPVFKRSDRLRELFLQEISRLVADLKDPGLAGFVTVTGLDLSPDMKNARVYYSILGSALDRESTARALERSAAYLRSKLLAKLDLKYIPKISFRYDETPERAHRIEALLNIIDAEKTGEAAPIQESRDLDALAAGRKTRRRRRGS